MHHNINRGHGRIFSGALALAAALTLSVPARADNANVTVYGQVNVSYDVLNTGTSIGFGATEGISSSRVSSNSSFLGLKDTNELGSGWSAQWQAELTLGTDTGASGGTADGSSVRAARLFDRNTYLGLANAGWGKLLMGRHDTPYKISTRRLDVFADGIGDNRSLMGTTVLGGTGGTVTETFDVRLSNLIAYFSPDMGGISVAIAYSNLSESNTTANQEKLSATSLAVMYEDGPVYASLAYEAHTSTIKQTSLLQADKSNSVKATRLGLGYKLGFLDLGVVLEKSGDDFGNVNAVSATNPCGNMKEGANCSGHSTYYWSAKFNLSDNDALKLAQGKAGQVGAADIDTGAIQFTMGIDHVINKRTTAYALYTSLKNDIRAHYALSSAASSGGPSSVNGTGWGGAAPTAFSFGIRHSF